MSELDEYADLLDSDDDDDENEWLGDSELPSIDQSTRETTHTNYSVSTRQSINQSTIPSSSSTPSPSSSPDSRADIIDHPSVSLRVSRTCTVKLSIDGGVIDRLIGKRILSTSLCSLSSSSLEHVKRRIHSTEAAIARARCEEARIESINQSIISPQDAEIALINQIDNLAHDEFEEEAMLEANEDAHPQDNEDDDMFEDDNQPTGDLQDYDADETGYDEDQPMMDINQSTIQPIDEADEDLGDIGEVPSERLTARQRARHSSTNQSFNRGDMSDTSIIDQPVNQKHKSEAQRERERLKYEQRKVQLEEEKQQVIDRLLHREAPNKENEQSTNQSKKKPTGPPTLIAINNTINQRSVSFPETYHLPEWMIKGSQAPDPPTKQSISQCANCSQPKRYIEPASMLPACSLACIQMIRPQTIYNQLVD